MLHLQASQTEFGVFESRSKVAAATFFVENVKCFEISFLF